MVPTLSTPRMQLVPLALEDAEQMQRVFPQWEIVRYLANRVPWPYPADGAEHYIRELALPAMDRGEEWHWTLRLRTAPDEIVGCISLMTTRPDHRGFWIVPEQRRRGLMTEAVERVTDFWFDELGMTEMRVAKAIENAGSRRISEQNGMRLIATEDRDYVCGRLPSEIWAIRAEEWRRRRAGAR